MLDELPALIAAGYADVAEEDVVRLKWWGLYHDKPKVGTFMLRVKLAAGRLTTPQLRAIGRLALEHGKGEAELTTRQNVQLHNLRLDALPQVFEELHAAALTSLGGCGDTVRAITGCPAAGIAARRALRRDAGARGGAPVLHGQPRLRRPAAQAQDLDLGMRVALQRAGDQLHLARRRPARRRAGLLACSSAAACRPSRGSRATSACSSARTRRSRCSARSSTRGATTSAGACRASSPG